MEVVIYSDEQQVGQVAANRILQWVEGLTTPVLGLATDNSPLALYNEPARRVKEGEIDLSCGIGFALNEYVGIDPENPLGYRQTILRTVVEPLCMDSTRVRVPNSSAFDLAAVALEYGRAVTTAGGVDVQVLSIDSNGHIGFNEPASSFASRTRAKTPTKQTRADSTRLFGEGERIPTHCMTQELGTIMEARHVVMVVTGQHKARAMTTMIKNPVAAMCPASILQFHPSVLVTVDEAAATGLNHADYFRYVIDILI